MSDNINFSLPDNKQEHKRSNKWSILLFLCLCLSIFINIYAVYLSSNQQKTLTSYDLPGDKQKDLALKLEKQGLEEHATEVWRDYLSQGTHNKEENARIWYRIGTLYEKINQYANALNAYYRSESFTEVKDLSNEINRKIQECLEGLGKFSALRYELAERVALKTNPESSGNIIIAEIGSQKITKAELDQKIESEIEHQIDQFASYLPKKEQLKQKESMLKQFDTASQKLQFINQFIFEEMLYRKAQEDNLTNDPEIRSSLKDIKRKFLARKLMEKEFSNEIKISENDLKTYYEANKNNYIQPEKAKISHILLADEETAKEVLSLIKEGEKFSEIAKEKSIDKSTSNQGGKIEEWIEKNSFIPGIGKSDELQTLIFKTESENIASNYVKTTKGFHIIKVRERKPEEQKTFEEVRTEIFRTIRAQKEKETQEQLFSNLKDRYNVIIHYSSFTDKKDTDKNEKP